MKRVNKELLKSCAKSIKLEMKESEYDLLEEEFEIILKQLDLMGEIEGIDEVIPYDYPFDEETTYLREDHPGVVLTPDEVLLNVKDHQEKQIKIPKVVN
ncbi:MAG TPA: Asp-tRNA(Asn)/Glu-tRNA(Gln) amidotransferase subunit GatC [Candidatus Onthovivens sp.]|nr:Asp-tRNA(Asn)/Glu-tRNA(Gln) amidotransferase subunit GatC [Candidatus Onthovivens sp.]